MRRQFNNKHAAMCAVLWDCLERGENVVQLAPNEAAAWAECNKFLLWMKAQGKDFHMIAVSPWYEGAGASIVSSAGGIARFRWPDTKPEG